MLEALISIHGYPFIPFIAFAVSTFAVSTPRAHNPPAIYVMPWAAEYDGIEHAVNCCESRIGLHHTGFAVPRTPIIQPWREHGKPRLRVDGNAGGGGQPGWARSAVDLASANQQVGGHDLRTPLAGIRAVSEAIADGAVSDGEVRLHAKHIEQESIQLAEMVDDLFEMSNTNASAVQAAHEKVALDEVADDVLAAHRIAAERAMMLRVSLPGQAGSGARQRPGVGTRAVQPCGQCDRAHTGGRLRRTCAGIRR
jgi:hypothetical protein